MLVVLLFWECVYLRSGTQGGNFGFKGGGEEKGGVVDAGSGMGTGKKGIQ